MSEISRQDHIDWFNNDGTVAFPSVGVSGGTAVDPGSGSAAIVVASDVYGMSSAWSRFLWEETYECDAGGLYVILGLPYGSVHIGEGAGGGAAVGFVESDLGVRGWLSIDGEEWIPLQSSLGLAVRPILVAADFNTVLLQQSAKQLGTSMAEESGPEGMPQLRTAFSAPHPNPFNPAAKLSFTLSKAMEVELTVFDVRGQVVRRLIDGPYSAGEHQLSWDGRTGRGKAVGSGVYLARLKAGGYVQTHRLTLVR